MSFQPLDRSIRQINTYLDALGAGDLPSILTLFSRDAWVNSPLAGLVQPAPFYRHLLNVSESSRLTLHDIAISHHGQPCAYARFTYEWSLVNGHQIQFDCIDAFTFDEDGRISRLDIVYDTYLVRSTVGDRLSLASAKPAAV